MSLTLPHPDAPGAQSPTGPRAEATRAAIVEAAERMFHSFGYQKTTVADIARELHMSPANVYRFFSSKAAINEAIAARLLGGLSELIWSIARGPSSPPDRIRLLFRTLQEQTVALFFHEKRMHDMVAAAMGENWSAIEAYIQSVDSAFRQVILDGQAAGVFARLDPDQTARLVHCMTVPFCHPTLVEQKCSDIDLPALAEGMAEFALRALRP